MIIYKIYQSKLNAIKQAHLKQDDKIFKECNKDQQ